MSSIDGIFSKLSLKVKFVLITTCAIVLLMCIIGFIAVEREKAILYTEAEREGKLLGETLAIPIVNDLIYERLGLVEEGGLLDNYILEIFSRRDIDLVYIMILNEDGKVVSHNNITEYGKVYSDSMTARSLHSDETIMQTFTSDGHKAMDFGVPLSIGKKRWGTLKFAVSLETIEREVLSTVWMVVILTLVIIASGFVLILLLSKRFISPIINIANTMERARG